MKVIHLIERINADKQGLTEIDPGDMWGSNDGGLYKANDGTQYYVKFMDEDHAKNELLAIKLYQLLGVKVPEVDYVDFNNKSGLQSKIIKGKTIMSWDYDTIVDSPDIKSNFVIDAWLANWDVAGMGGGNTLIDEDGNVYRIDTGGALIYRQQGQPKGSKFGKLVGELKTLRYDNADSSQVFQNVLDSHLRDGAKKLLSVPSEKIKQLVMEYGPGSQAEKETLFDILEQRRHYIQKQVNSQN